LNQFTPNDTDHYHSAF